MNEAEKMWACTVWRSHLFLDGRFTRGAASIWPAESDGGKRKNIVVICVACRRSSDKSFELNASSDQQSLIGEFLSLTLVAGDHVTDLLEDVREAGGARDLGVLLGGGEPPRAH